MFSMRKQILKHKKIKEDLCPKNNMENYILYKDDRIYVGMFPVDLEMLQKQISSTAHGEDPLPVGKSVNIRYIGKFLCRLGHPYVKYNCVIFGTNVFFIFLFFKICFLIENYCKRLNVFSDLLKITRIF